MPHRNMPLGQAMAYIVGSSGRQVPTDPELSDSKVVYIDDLEHRMEKIRERGEASRIIESHTGRCCDNSAGIAGDEAFFLSCLVVGEDATQPEAVISFLKHMNNCYACFSAFSEVFRDYYQQRVKLSNQLPC